VVRGGNGKLPNPLFPVVEIMPEAFDSFRQDDFPLARERLLRKVLNERCILLKPKQKLPDELASCRPRYIDDHSGKVDRLPNFNEWESVLDRRLFLSAAIVRQGQEALDVIRPAALSSRAISIIDPYALTPLCNEERKWEQFPERRSWVTEIKDRQFLALQSILRTDSDVEVIQSVGRLDRPGYPTSQREVVEALRAWFSAAGLSLNSLNVYLYPELPGPDPYKVHDRFLGFADEHIDSRSSIALSVGYGLQAFDLERRHPCETCFSVIPPEEFSETWNQAEKKCTWLITYQSDRQRPSGWKAFEEPTVLKNGKFVSVYQRRT